MAVRAIMLMARKAVKNNVPANMPAYPLPVPRMKFTRGTPVKGLRIRGHRLHRKTD
jgi:hypothetical protein